MQEKAGNDRKRPENAGKGQEKVGKGKGKAGRGRTEDRVKENTLTEIQDKKCKKCRVTDYINTLMILHPTHVFFSGLVNLEQCPFTKK